MCGLRLASASHTGALAAGALRQPCRQVSPDLSNHKETLGPVTFDLLQVPPVTDRPGPLPPADSPSTSSPLAEGPHPCFSRESIRQESLSALCQQPVSARAQNSRYWLFLCRLKFTPLRIRGDTPPLLVLLRCHTELLKLCTPPTGLVIFAANPSPVWPCLQKGLHAPSA